MASRHSQQETLLLQALRSEGSLTMEWYAEDYYAVAPRQDPQGPLRGSCRVLRGGDWSQGPLELRASTRAWDEMTYWGPTLGVRCAADVP